MLRAVLRMISSSSRSSVNMRSVLQQQRHVVSCAGSLHQKAVHGCVVSAAALSVRRQQLSSFWQAWPARQLHNTVAHAAASDQEAPVDEEVKFIYPAEYDPNYVCFSCVTGTVDKVEPLEGPSGKWLKFTMRVPTPNTEQSFTIWHCMCHGDLADKGRDYVHEGAYIQASGTYLVSESLEKAGWSKLLPQPALFAESIGFFDANINNPIDHIMLPVMNQQDLDTFINSGGQQLYAPGPPPPAAPPGPPAAAPIEVPEMPAQPSNDVEAAWMSVFRENHLWYDNRTTKQGRQPDFKLREKPADGRKDALWLTDRLIPFWVKLNLQLLPGNMPHPEAAMVNFIPPGAAASSNEFERQWVQVFSNYSNFWDNRVNKKNPRAPDFSPKDRDNGGKALWLEDRNTPQWVKDNLDKLPAPPPPRP